MRPEDVWKEFKETKDIARAGRRILSLAKELRSDVMEYLRPPEKRKVKSCRPRSLRKGIKLTPRVLRTPKRYPLRSELVNALRWMERKLREIARSTSIPLITKWDLPSEIRRIKERILSLIMGGRKSIPLRELVKSPDELVATLISLLFMEKDGEVELVQERPFDEIYVVLQDGRS